MSQPAHETAQIAVMGNSFGGIETVLGAEHAGYCAAVDAAGAAESCDGAPDLQHIMLHAVQHRRVASSVSAEANCGRRQHWDKFLRNGQSRDRRRANYGD